MKDTDTKDMFGINILALTYILCLTAHILMCLNPFEIRFSCSNNKRSRLWCLPGASSQILHQLSDPRVQWLPGGGSGDLPFSQWRRGKVSLLSGAESAGLEHQTLPPVQSVHLPEGAQPQPLRAQVQGKMTVYREN